MRFYTIIGLTASLAIGAPLSDVANEGLEKRGYAAFFCSGLCAASTVSYPACIAACLATAVEGDGVVTFNTTALPDSAITQKQ